MTFLGRAAFDQWASARAGTVDPLTEDVSGISRAFEEGGQGLGEGCMYLNLGLESI